MNTNETQSKEWTGDGWRVIARPGQVIAMLPNFDDWVGPMFMAIEGVASYADHHRGSGYRPGYAAALEAAIAYAWPESVGTFTERGVTI